MTSSTTSIGLSSAAASSPKNALNNALSALASVLDAAGAGQSAFSDLLSQIDTSGPSSALTNLAAQIQMQNSARATTGAQANASTGASSQQQNSAPQQNTTPDVQPDQDGNNAKSSQKTRTQDRGQGGSSQNQSSSSNQQTAQANGADGATGSADAAAGTQTAKSDTDTSSTTGGSSDTATGDGKDPVTLTDAQIIQMIQELLHHLAKKPVDASGNATQGTKDTTTAQTGDTTSPTNADPSAIEKAKQDLEALLAALEKNGAATGDASQSMDGTSKDDKAGTQDSAASDTAGTASSTAVNVQNLLTLVPSSELTPTTAAPPAPNAAIQALVSALQARQSGTASTSGVKTSDSSKTTTDAAANQDAAAGGASMPSSTVGASESETLAARASVTGSADKDPLSPAIAFQNLFTPAPANQPAAQPAFSSLTGGDQLAGGSGAGAGQDGASLNSNANQQGGNAASFMADMNASANASASANNAVSSLRASPYSFASQLTATHASSTMLASGAVDQVVLQLNRSAKNGDNEMTLQLHPADLGKITVKLDIAADGKVHGMVTADNQSTLNMLSKDSRSLERALQDAGLHADQSSLQFSMSGGQSGQSSWQSSGGSGGRGNNENNAPSVDGVTDAATSASVVETYYLTPNGVNLSV